MYTGYLNTERNCSYQKAGIVNYILDLNSACMKAFPLAPSILRSDSARTLMLRCVSAVLTYVPAACQVAGQRTFTLGFDFWRRVRRAAPIWH